MKGVQIIGAGLSMLAIVALTAPVFAGGKDRQNQKRQGARQDHRQVHSKDQHQDRRANRQDAGRDRRDDRRDRRETYGDQLAKKHHQHVKRHHERMINNFDANSDGKIDRAERQAARESNRAHREKMRRAVDANNDGVISDVEWDEFRGEKFDYADAGEDAQARFKKRHPEMFKHFDENNDGWLDTNERQMARKEMHERRLDRLEELDANGDGRFEQEERIAFHLDRRVGSKDHPGKHKGQRTRSALVEEFDANGDGRLTGAEATRAHKAMIERRKAGKRAHAGSDDDES